jgi:hypothetical protein
MAGFFPCINEKEVPGDVLLIPEMWKRPGDEKTLPEDEFHLVVKFQGIPLPNSRKSLMMMV